MKKKYLLIGILMVTTLQAYTQKPENSVKPDSEYNLEGIYDPTMKSPESGTIPEIISLASFELKYFEKEKLIRLNWSMSKKLGTFIIEHTVNGQPYQEIGKVDNPIGFEKSQYTFDAKEFEKGLNFYRLKQEINGKIIYSEIKSVIIEESSSILLIELSDKGNAKRIELRSREIQNVVVQLYDAEGNLKKELLNQDMAVNEIIFRDIQKNDFPKGDYFILVKGQNFRQSKKITLP